MNPFFTGVETPKHFWLWVLLAIWISIWKGYAFWTAAKRNDKIWFIVFLFVQTCGILEIIYIFWIVKKTWTEVQSSFSRFFTPKKKHEGKEK